MRHWSVRDVMTVSVVTVSETASYREIVAALTRHGVSAVPVTDGDGRVVGVVSEADLLPKMELAGLPEHVRLLGRKRRREARAKATADTAQELMSAPAVVCRPGDTLGAAARLMDLERVKRLPVVDFDGTLQGIVSRRDLLGVYLRDDVSIRAEVVEQVLLHDLWIDPDTITVTVDAGVVTLIGTVDRRSTVPLVVRLVGSVAGVMTVVDHLTYRYDDSEGLRRQVGVGMGG